MDDLVGESLGVQNQLSSDEDIYTMFMKKELELKINRLRRPSSTVGNAQDAILQPKEVRDATSDRKEESPPRQPKAQPCTDDKSLLDENAPPSKTSSDAAATSQKGEDNDSRGKMKGDRHNLIDDDHAASEKIEETHSSSNGIKKEPKENVASGSQLNVNETMASNQTPSETDFQDATAQPKEEVRDATSYRKEESPSLPSPQQPKAQPCTDDKSLLDENAPPSKSSSDAAATSQKVEHAGEDNDSKGKMKGDRHNLIDDDHAASEKIEENHSSSKEIKKEPKENVASGSQLNVNETMASNQTKKDITHTPSETDFEESADISTYAQVSLLPLQRASARVHTDSNLISPQVQEQYCRVEVIDQKSNGEDNKSTNIHKQKAACRQCNRLIDVETLAFNVNCNCTKTSLVHVDCMDEWSQEKRDKCQNCDGQIRTMEAKVTSISSQTSGENPKMPPVPTRTRSWCCLC